MTDKDTTEPCRREVLAAAGLLTLGITPGCAGLENRVTGGEGGDECGSPPEDLAGSVPEQYRGAESKGGTVRQESDLISKSKAGYQRSSNGNQRCSKCSYFVPDENGDCAGACVRVEGLIDPSGWCEYYRAYVGGGW